MIGGDPACVNVLKKKKKKYIYINCCNFVKLRQVHGCFQFLGECERGFSC